MALQLEAARQGDLLELAELDARISAAQHRRASLPALARLADLTDQSRQLRRSLIDAETEVDELQRATRKLDAEVEQVRARAQRDAVLLQSGAAAPKELENLQHEIESLRRRQSVLEDEELELMEQRENAEIALNATRASLTTLEQEAGGLEADRDREFAAIDAQLGADRAARSELAAGLPADVLALYSRVAGSGGKVAAGKLVGGRCSACRLEIDRTALAEIQAAAPDAVVRCPECGAILVRS